MGRYVFGSLVALVFLAAAAGPASGGAVGSGPLRITAGPVHLEVSPAERAAWAVNGSGTLGRAEAWLRSRSFARGSGVEARLSWSETLVRRAVAAAAARSGSIEIPEAVSTVTLAAPLLRQRYRNNCEATALAVALREPADQDRLQRALPIAPPLTKRDTSSGLVWGDPEIGFVGDVVNGGYGVYDRPLLAVARTRDADAENLTGRPLATVLAALRDGRPIVAWVTLGASRPFTWRTPSGAVVHADWAEHAITLTSWSRGLIGYVDPADGSRKTFAVADLAGRWLPLGRRALALSPRLARAH